MGVGWKWNYNMDIPSERYRTRIMESFRRCKILEMHVSPSKTIFVVLIFTPSPYHDHTHVHCTHAAACMMSRFADHLNFTASNWSMKKLHAKMSRYAVINDACTMGSCQEFTFYYVGGTGSWMMFFVMSSMLYYLATILAWEYMIWWWSNLKAMEWLYQAKWVLNLMMTNPRNVIIFS